nr:hypothetical protein [Tanacetum cinerariifolium]
MATTIEQQVAMYEALVPSTQRLRIEKSNFRLPSDIQSKESTLQLVYDVLRRCSFFKSFLVTADVPEIYMHEFWATAYIHQHSIRFKMNNKKHIVNLESFRDMLHISPRIPGQSFDELPFEEEILEFIRFLKHSATIRTLTDGLYHKRNIDYAFLIWEDFVYQVEHKNHKKSNEMYYPRFTKVIIHHFMSKDPSIPRRNKVNWHYVRDDFLFSTIKVVSRHQNTQQYGAMLPIELTNDEIRNTKAHKEYYAFATGEAVRKPKASARRKRSDSDTFITPPTATQTPKPTVTVTPRLTVAAKGKQTAKSLFAPSEPGGSGTDEGTGTDDQGKDGDDDEGDEGDESDKGEEDADEDKDGDQRDDDKENQEVAKFDEQDDDEGGGDDERKEKVMRMMIMKKQGKKRVLTLFLKPLKAVKMKVMVRKIKGRGLQATREVKDTHVTLTSINSDGQQESSSVSSQFVTSMLNPTSDV